MADSLTFEHFLELSLAAPGGKLAAVVGEDFSRSAPLADGPFYHLKHRLCGLLAEQPVAYDIARVVVNDPDKVDLIHLLELESEDVNLP